MMPQYLKSDKAHTYIIYIYICTYIYTPISPYIYIYIHIIYIFPRPIIVGPIHSSKFCGVFSKGPRPWWWPIPWFPFRKSHQSCWWTLCHLARCLKGLEVLGPGDPLGNPKMTEMILPLKIDSWLEGDLPLCHLARWILAWKFWAPGTKGRILTWLWEKNPDKIWWLEDEEKAETFFGRGTVEFRPIFWDEMSGSRVFWVKSGWSPPVKVKKPKGRWSHPMV